jgi:PAS domain S-box-containing protein
MRLTTRARVATAFVAALVVASAVGAIAVGAARSVAERLDGMAGTTLPLVQAVDTLNVSTEVELRSLSALMHEELTDPHVRSKLHEDIQQARKDAATATASIEALPRSEEVTRIWSAVQKNERAFAENAGALLALLRERHQAGTRFDGFRARAWPLYLRTLAAMEPLDHDLDTLGDQVSREAEAARSSGNRVAQEAVRRAVIAVGLGAAFILGIGLRVARRVGRALQQLRDQATSLSGAVLEGRFGARADREAVDPEFRAICDGLNRTMDAFCGPIQMTASYVGRISKGDIPPRITAHCEGDFNDIKDNLNHCIEAVSGLVQDTGALSRATAEGMLSSRADPSRYRGDFRKVIEGVNATLDAMLAIEGSHLAYLDWDLRSDRINYSPLWPGLLGYGPDDIEPSYRAWARLAHPEDAERVRADVVAHVKGHSPSIDTEYRMRAKDGAWKWVQSRARVVERDAQGRALRVAGMHDDVTRRREAEERLRLAHEANERLITDLRASEERLRLALSSGTHAEWDWDVVQDRFSHGESWWNMLGVEPSQVPDTIAGWRSVVCPDDLHRTWSALQDCVAGRTSDYEGHYRIRHADGSWRWVRSRGRVVARSPDGRALRITGTRTDVTEVDLLQEKLLAATRLASVGTLAAGVAHEINNPLAWVSSNLNFALEELGECGKGPEHLAVREALAEASEGAARIASVVKSMRSLGRPERRGEAGAADVRAELFDAIHMVKNQVAHRACLEVQVPDVLPPARARTSELGRVFLNLLVNASQAIPEGQADRNRITVVARREGDAVVVEISDTGAGIAQELRERIFEAFFTTKPVGVGTGLGLTIARSIVERAGGRMELDSEEGRGSTFRVFLPVADRVGAPAPDVGSTAEAAAPRHSVLIVDDEPLVRRSLARALARRHDVTTVGSGAEALRRIDEGERFDAVLCDLMMPSMDGIAFYGALAARDPSWLPRVAFVTGGAFGERATRFLTQNAIPTLPKPIEPAALLAEIERLASAARAGRGLVHSR